MAAMYVACNNTNCVRCHEGRCTLDTINLRTADVERYKVQTAEALNWMGVGVTTAAKKKAS